MNASFTHDNLRDGQVAMFAAMLDEQRQFRFEQIEEQSVRVTDDREATAAENEIRGIIVRGAIAALADIDAAIARIKRGTYGRCTDCSAPIPFERLEILPHSPRCLSCERAR